MALSLEKIKQPLIEKLSTLNIYELERLRECFKYDLRIHPENETDIKDIIEHIMIVIDQKVTQQ